MRTWIFLLCLSLISDMIAAAVISVQLWALRNGRQNSLVRIMAVLFASLFIRGACELVAHGFGFVTAPRYTPGYALFYWLGRAVVTISMWYFLFHLLRKPS